MMFQTLYSKNTKKWKNWRNLSYIFKKNYIDQNLVQLIADFTGINFDRNVKIGKERTGKDHSYKTR